MHSSTQCESAEHEDVAAAIRLKLEQRNKHGWRLIVLHFMPSWFAATMGTGIVSILLHNLPYNSQWLRWISIALFGLNILLFMLFCILSVTRYCLYRGIFVAMIRHPVQSLFLGTFPMGFATIVNMFIYVCVPVWGRWAVTFAWAMWWIDAVVSICCCMFLPFAIMHIHTTQSDGCHKLQAMTAVWLLPIVSTIVASATGGIVAEALADANQHAYALLTMFASYILLGTGLPLAMVILVIYFQRLTLYHLPPQHMIVSVFLPLGPLGQGSFSIMQLGRVALRLQPQFASVGSTLSQSAATTIYSLGIVVALVMWGYGLVWLFFALVSITRNKFVFNLGTYPWFSNPNYRNQMNISNCFICDTGWWGFTFPLGVYAVSTMTLGVELSSSFFKILGLILSLAVIFLWLLVSIKTSIAALNRSIFTAPCVKDFEHQWLDNQVSRYVKLTGKTDSNNAISLTTVERAF